MSKKLKEPEDMIDNKSKLIHVFGWYNEEKSKDDAKEYLIEYCTKHHPEHLSVVKNTNMTNIVPTYAWLSRMIMRGLVVDDYSDYIEKYIKSLYVHKKEEQVTKKYIKPEFDIDGFIGELEDNIDQYFKTKKVFDINDNINRASTPSKFIPTLKQWANKKIEQFSEEESEEIYTINTKSLQKLITCLTIQEKKRIIKKKKVDPYKQSINLKYLDHSQELGITSVKPVHIIGSNIMITYNTKFNMLSLYRSDSKDGLFVKGSSVYNFIECMGKKRLKNPKEMLNDIMTCSKEAIMDVFDSFKTTPMKINGQMNEFSLIVRIE